MTCALRASKDLIGSMNMILKRFLENGRFHWVLAIALLVQLSAVNTPCQSRAPDSVDSKPASNVQEPNKSETAGPAANQVATSLVDNSSDPIDSDIRRLHLLAAELRTEVGRTYKESLSMNVLKKAKEIEILSKSLKERMDQRAAAERHHQK